MLLSILNILLAAILTIENVRDIAQIAAILLGSSIIPTAINWWINRKNVRRMEDVNARMEHNTLTIQLWIAAVIQKAIADRDPASYRTLKLRFPGGHWLSSPIIQGMTLPCYTNITICGISHNQNETLAMLVCDGFGVIGNHTHDEEETIRVESGSMTCMATGKRYVAGDTWVIPADVEHGAFCTDLVAILRYHPPLPDGVERPVNLDAMEDIFSPKK